MDRRAASSTKPGPIRVAVRLVGLAVFAALVGCRGAAPQPALPGPAAADAAAVAVAGIFESPEPYSPRVLDAAGFAAFFSRYPVHRADSASMERFYAHRGRQFAWLIGDSLTSGADAFLGLAGISDTADPHVAALARRLVELRDAGLEAGGQVPLCDSCALDLELRLTAEFFHFAGHHYAGHLGGDLRELNWYIPRAKLDLARLVDSLTIGRMDLSAYEPPHPQYRLLRAALARSHALAGAPWPVLTLPRGRGVLRLDDAADVVRDLRHRFHQLGDLDRDDTVTVVDGALVAAVERFQARHGLTTDGIIGPAVLRALNVPPAERSRTILLNMERLRWMPDERATDALVVNIPEFKLRVYEAGREVMSMRAVVGTHATRTVIFASTLTSVVLSPSWSVPPSIVRKEILPALAKDPDYLTRNEMDVIGGTGTLPMLRQRPGPDNPLGGVKFVFPNSFGIFMHDTPARSLFELDQRAFSHGCIRLSEPRALAEYLLREDPAWPSSRIGDVMVGRTETTVPLARPRPVFVVYFTSWIDADGRLNFRDDLYRHDRRLAAELFR